MELSLRPYHQNLYPFRGLLIRGAAPELWLDELERMRIPLEGNPAYGLPGPVPNSVWGCVVLLDEEPEDIGAHQRLRQAFGSVLLPEFSVLHPRLDADEARRLFPLPVLAHPEIGWVELAEPIDWGAALPLPTPLPLHLTTPLEAPSAAPEVLSFALVAPPTEEALEAFEEMGPGTKKDQPLTLTEKLRLQMLRLLLSGKKETNGSGSRERSALAERLVQLFGESGNRKLRDLELDLDELEKRNQKSIDRLMELLKKNPEEALQYAIPLDETGTGRGGGGGRFDLSKRWSDFSLFNNFGMGGNAGPGASVSNDAMRRLRDQYVQSAEELERNGQFRKAAFIYLKLLKDPLRAAQVLEKAGLFAEAAAIYLQHLKMTGKAAECYEKGRMLEKALELYLELGQREKAGDLLLQLHRRADALFYYRQVVDGYLQSHQYLKASQVLRQKMQLEEEAQEALLRGWSMGQDAFNCLDNYFAHIGDDRLFAQELHRIQDETIADRNREVFLRVIQHEFRRRPSQGHLLRELGYTLVSQLAGRNPGIVSELKTFEPNDPHLVKDTLRFKLHRRRKR